MADQVRKKVVIVGGGFAGLYAARALSKKDVDVVLIDKKNHHTFQPLLYQVATTVLAPAQIANPLRTILHAHNVEVLLDEMVGIDLTKRQLKLAKTDTVSYDYLVLAAGARHSYFGHDEWEEFAPGIKTIEDAIHVRQRILLAFERAEREAFLDNVDSNLTFAVIGGGPTGVEIAGAIVDIATRSVAPDFKHIDTKKTKVMLFEGSHRILGTFPEDLSKKAMDQLEQLGVVVRTGSQVDSIEEGRIRVKDQWVTANIIVWATGVAASPLGKLLGAELDKAGRVPVEPDLTLKGHPEVFVIGDMSSLTDTAGVQVPGLGAAAIQEGVRAAKNILADVSGRPRKPFKYLNKGTLAAIGRNRAIADFGIIHLSGFIAWISWAVVHIYLMIGFGNRFAVMWEWFWSYLTRHRTARLITGDDL